MTSLDTVMWLLFGVGMAFALAFWLLGLRAPSAVVLALVCLAFSIDAAVAGDGGAAVVFAVCAALLGRRALTVGGAR